MKYKYSTPIINVEELTEIDVLCASSEAEFNTPDNSHQTMSSLGEFWDLGNFM